MDLSSNKSLSGCSPKYYKGVSRNILLYCRKQQSYNYPANDKNKYTSKKRRQMLAWAIV